MRIERVSRTNTITIAEVKAFANITTTTDDTQITRIMNAAISTVEDITGVSLSANTLKYFNEGLSTIERLPILPAASITSVVDAATGTAVTYTLSNDKSKVTFTGESDIVVTYVTSAVADDNLKQLAIELASAYYDGQEKAVIDGILAKLPR